MMDPDHTIPVTDEVAVHESTRELPVSNEAPGMTIRNVHWGEMIIGYLELPAGTDFTPFFQGLPNDMCHCAHWGYVIKGAVHLRYVDGTEEITRAGEVFYWPGGHTGWVEEDTIFIDFSPEKEFQEVAENMARIMGGGS